MINRVEFNKRLADRLDVSQKTATKIVDTIQDLIFDSLEESDRVKFGEFLVMEKKVVKEKPYKLPTGEIGVAHGYNKYSCKLSDRFKKQYV